MFLNGSTAMAGLSGSGGEFGVLTRVSGACCEKVLAAYFH